MSVAASRTLDEVRVLAREYNLIPLSEELIADCETPVSAFLKLRGSGPAFLLESAEQGLTFGRYSFIGFQPREVLRWSLGDGGDPYEIAAAAVARYRQAPLDGLPEFLSVEVCGIYNRARRCWANGNQIGLEFIFEDTQYLDAM